MKALLLVLCVCLVSCSSTVKRTIKSDKTMRVMIDPSSARGNYINVQTALVSNGRFMVVDRHNGYRAVTKEQDRSYTYQSRRFANNQKFAHYGKLYGVGAVVIAKAQCRNTRSVWMNASIQRCLLFLNLVDANTGEVVVGVKDEKDAPHGAYPDWDEAVEKLVSVYPEYFTEVEIHQRLKNYMEESEKHFKNHQKPKVEVILPHDDNFDENGKALNADEVLKRVNKRALSEAGVSY